MGLHFVPEFFLNNFTNSENKIYCYSSNNPPFLTTPTSIANENKLYSKDTEKYLANKIEYPVIPIIELLKSHNNLSKEEKTILTSFIVAQLKRTPTNKKWFRENAKEVIRKVTKETIRKEKNNEIKFEITGEKLKNRLLEIEKEISNNPPSEIWEELIITESTPYINTVLLSMNWTFFIAPEPYHFLCCDNPVFYFKEIGIASHPHSSLSFPITSSINLLLHWSRKINTGFVKASSNYIQEFNRRTVFNAETFVFSKLNENWILKYLLQMKPPSFLVKKEELPTQNFFLTKKFLNENSLD